MKLTVGFRDTTQDKLIEGLNILLRDDVRFAELFPKFGVPRVQEVHPFALVTEAILNGSTAQAANIFPCISVGITTENLRTQNVLGVQSQMGVLTQQILDNIKATDPNIRLFTDYTTQQLQKWLTQGAPVRYDVQEALYDATIILSIWSENFRVTQPLYEIAKMYLTTAFESVMMPLGWENIVWNGDRSGLYNYDYGRALHGATLTIRASNSRRYLLFDSEGAAQFTSVVDPIKGLNTDGANPNGAVYNE